MKTPHDYFMSQDFPRIKQPKPQFPEVAKNDFEATDEQVDDFIYNLDRKLII